MEKTVAFWGSFTVFILGIVLTINAALDSQFVGAGLLLLACALASGVVGLIFSKK